MLPPMPVCCHRSIFRPSDDYLGAVIEVGAGSQALGLQGSRRVTGLLGRSTGLRGELVCGRLGAFVAPVVEVEAESTRDLEWVRQHNAKVRESVRGSVSLTQRLSGESDEPEPERLPERVVKGEAFMVKMLEQRMRRSRPSE
jgi:hypothetical protein